MKKKYIVELTDSDRAFLKGCVDKGKNTAYEIKHAHILLKADAAGPAWTDTRIAEAFGCHAQTVYNVRRSFVGAWLVWGVIPRNAAKAVARPET